MARVRSATPPADTSTQTTTAVILAAGLGTRMRSALPKGIQPLAGKPLLRHILDTLSQLKRPPHIQVIAASDNIDLLQQAAGSMAERIQWTLQEDRLGTGHAVRIALEDGETAPGPVLVMFADVPMIRPATIDRLIADYWQPGGVALLSMELKDPSSYGRIMRDNTGKVLGVVEQADATREQAAIREVNTGVLVADSAKLSGWLQALPRHDTGEYYLPDIIAMAGAQKASVQAMKLAQPEEAFGANDKFQLHALERYWQGVQAEELMRQGVWIADAARLDIRGDVEVGKDSFLDIGVVLEGEVKIGANVHIAPYCCIRNSVIEDGALIQANSWLNGAHVGKGATIGPYARLREGSRIGAKARVGNFVEVKNATLGDRAKASHLSYIGDAEVGPDTNVGAGVITCNYDGEKKHRTEIGRDVFIGSNSALVAPVRIEDGAAIGAGSTITRDVAKDMLALTRSEQKNLKKRKLDKKPENKTGKSD